MKVKALSAVKSKLFKPCKNVYQIFKFKLRKPFFIKSLPPRSCYKTNNKFRKSPLRTQISSLLSGFRQLKQSKKMDRLLTEDLRSETENPGRDQVLYPSPITPNFLIACGSSKRVNEVEDVEDACRSLENYLVEMIVEEGKVGDLTDVEELLYCWKNLKCPVFVDLVCRFYGELCKDLFSPEDDQDHDNLLTQPK